MIQKTKTGYSSSARRNINTVQKAAYEQFQQALLKGHLRAGQLVSQRDLIDLLGLSISALRELLPRLQAEGLLTVMPQRGIQITAIDLPMIRDAFQMRLCLEREAVITAVNSLSDQTIQQQRDYHLDILSRLSEESSSELLDEGQVIDSNFHELLINNTKNELIIQAYNVNSIRIKLIKMEKIRLSETVLPAAFADHLAIIDALAKRDQARAVSAMQAHIQNARDRAIAF